MNVLRQNSTSMECVKFAFLFGWIKFRSTMGFTNPSSEQTAMN